MTFTRGLEMFWRTQTKSKGLTPAIGDSPNFYHDAKFLSDSNSFISYCSRFSLSLLRISTYQTYLINEKNSIIVTIMSLRDGNMGR